MTWVTERPEDVEFTPPPGLTIEMIPSDKSLDDMLATGEARCDDLSVIPRSLS